MMGTYYAQRVKMTMLSHPIAATAWGSWSIVILRPEGQDDHAQPPNDHGQQLPSYGARFVKLSGEDFDQGDIQK
jgi:hypothetical protein